MAKETTDKRPSAAESLVKATVTVLDNVNVQAQFMRASMEAAKRLGAHKLTYLSWSNRKVMSVSALREVWT